MKDPARLLHQGASPAELALLQAGASEEPSDEAIGRLSAALGVGAIASTVATKSSAPGSAVGGAASKITAKWIIAGAVGLAGGGALVFTHTPSQRPEPSPSARHGALVPAPPPPAGAPAEPSSAAPTEPAAVIAPATPETKAGSAARSSRHGASPSIAREIADLDGARRLLGAGDARGALRALDAYEVDARSGVLRQEASLLRIEALASAGEVASARRLARAFLREHPGSPHEARVRALAGESH